MLKLRKSVSPKPGLETKAVAYATNTTSTTTTHTTITTLMTHGSGYSGVGGGGTGGVAGGVLGRKIVSKLLNFLQNNLFSFKEVY